MATADQLLEAGALIPTKAKVKNDTGVDPISARIFRHSALGVHPIVKLTPDNLASGIDLTMSFLGCEEPTVTGPIAKRRRQALGFPEWALVNDPKHARYALELVKDFKKEARRARSKPGHAYDGFVATSKHLGKSVAHFLPSFWEQVGREYIVVGNATYASRAFGKAREAEKVHGLKVEERIRKDAFLEFALAGCVSNKALTEYGKDLLGTHKPKEAWEFFRELCIRRTLGGMPPWTSMFKDLAGLVKTAKLDPAKELEAILTEVIDSPALARAPMGFWKGASSLIAELVKKNDHVAGVLLNLIPKTSSWSQDDVWPWLDYLESWGILQNAWDPKASTASAPQSGPAAWFTRLYSSTGGLRQRIYDILESMAPRLKKDKTPLILFRKECWGNDIEADADLLDLALSLKIKLANPAPATDVDISLYQWSKIDEDEDPNCKDRPRDLVLLAKDKRFQKSLRDAVQSVAGNPNFEIQAAGKSGLTELRREWLMNHFGQMEKSGLPQTDQTLDVIQDSMSCEMFAEFPDAFAALKNTDLVPIVTQTLRGGIIDEYGWPAFEQLYDKVATKDSKPQVFGHFPYAIVSDGLTAHVLRGNEIITTVELRLPKGHKLDFLMYLDGDLAVWASKNREFTAWWHSQPKTKDKGYFYGHSGMNGMSVDLPGGGSFTGGRTIHVGHQPLTDLSVGGDYFHDGEHFWQLSWSDNYESKEFREVDIATGKTGRRSRPTWFEDFVDTDWKLNDEQLSIGHLGDAIDGSPLGSRDGMTGFRVRHRKDITEYQGIDGRALKTSGHDHQFQALLNQPGTKALLPIDDSGHLWNPDASICVSTLTDTIGPYNRGQSQAFPLPFFHMLTVRDEASSKVLRKITQKQVKTLVDAEQADIDAWSGKGSPSEDTGYKKLDKAIKAAFPKLKERRLQQGLRGIIAHAGRKARLLAKLIQQKDPANAGASQQTKAADLQAEKAMQIFEGYFSLQKEHSFFASLADAGAWFAGETDDPRVFPDYLDSIEELLKGVTVNLWRVMTKEKLDADRSWLSFFIEYSNLPLISLDGKFRSFSGNATKKNPVFPIHDEDAEEEYDEDDKDAPKFARTFEQKGNRYLVHRTWGTRVDVIEYAPTGKFLAIKGIDLDPNDVKELPKSYWNAKQLRTFVAKAQASPITLPDLDLVTRISDETGLSVAETLYIWFGYPGHHEYARNDAIPAHLRDPYKLKVKDCASAKQKIELLPNDVQDGLLRSLLSGAPEELWNSPEAIGQRIATSWKALKPNRLELPDDVTTEIVSSLSWQVDNTEYLVALSDPANSPLFGTKTKWELKPDDNGHIEFTNNAEETAFDGAIMHAAVSTIACLSYRLSVNDRAKSTIPTLLKAVQAATNNPNLIFDGHGIYLGDKDDKAIALIAKVVAKPKPIKGKFEVSVRSADDGIMIAAQQGGFVRTAFRPAKLKTDKQYERLQSQLMAFFDVDHVNGPDIIAAIKLLRSPDFKAIAARANKSPVAAGEFETNPLLSAPELVATIAKKHNVGEEAAAYYLQLLALPDPTDKNVKTWNGWTPAQIKKLGKELIAKKLVQEGKRPRAGRVFFLPGGWESLKSPHLPIETWKLPLFQMNRDNYDRATPPLSRIIPLEPVHTLFEKAWQRTQTGDVPKYEEVTT